MSAMMQAVGEVLPVKMPKQYHEQKLNLIPFIRRMNTYTEPYKVFNELQTDASMPIGSVVASGLWLPKKELPENGSRADVRVIWHAHPKTRRVTLTPLKWDRRRFYYWQRIGHELVHRYQEAGRPPDAEARTYHVEAVSRNQKEQQSYYGNYDELEAYAHDAALEMMSWYGAYSFHEAQKWMENWGTAGAVVPTYNTYLAVFGSSHPAVHAFKRKCRAWWDIMQKSKDFYTSLELPRLV